MNNNKLIEYIPQVLQDVEEYKAILEDGEQEEIDILWQELSNILNNQFIFDTNEKGIARYEKLLNIKPNSYDTLLARQSRVVNRWNDQGVYTLNVLKEKLTMLCGENNFSIVTDFENYSITVNVALPLSGQVDELEYMFKWIIPANIVVTTNNNLVRDIDNGMYQGTPIVSSKRYTIDGEVE